MTTKMAVSPDGGIAVRSGGHVPAQDITGHAYDPFGDVWHWTGRTPYEPAERTANMLLQVRPDNWERADPDVITARLKPKSTVTLTEGGESLADRIAALNHEDSYLMAMAAAKSILRNMTNGTSCATFSDGSQAYIMPDTLEVRPAH